MLEDYQEFTEYKKQKMLISNKEKDIINISQVSRIKKLDENSTYSILFDADKWEYADNAERDAVYSYIVENFTKKI
jgi:hypothetical protein